MQTFFTSPERTDQETLTAEIAFASSNPVISGLLSSVGGLVAVLDKNRQIIAMNDSFFKLLGEDNPSSVLGLRPGEALHCIHAEEEPGGCGTSRFCLSCGAVIAAVSSLEQDKPVEQICTLSTERNGKAIDTALLVRCQPIRIEEQRFILLFVQDVTRQQQRAALERAFFHDINNMLCLLAGAATLMAEDNPSELADTVLRTSIRLSKEVEVHRCLVGKSSADCRPVLIAVRARDALKELRAFYVSCSDRHAHKLEFTEQIPDVVITTDFSLLLRVLCNMVTNALEASSTDMTAKIKIWLEEKDEELIFCVWNGQAIPPEIQLRIFRLYFSTKDGQGRGIGTYSMKLLGETILGGTVSFTSSEEEGTVFRFALPIQGNESAACYG